MFEYVSINVIRYHNHLKGKEAKLSIMILGLKNKNKKKNITEQYCIFREGFYNSWSWVDGYLNCKKWLGSFKKRWRPQHRMDVIDLDIPLRLEPLCNTCLQLLQLLQACMWDKTVVWWPNFSLHYVLLFYTPSKNQINNFQFYPNLINSSHMPTVRLCPLLN